MEILCKTRKNPNKKKAAVVRLQPLLCIRAYDSPALKANSFRGGMKTRTDASRYII